MNKRVQLNRTSGFGVSARKPKKGRFDPHQRHSLVTRNNFNCALYDFISKIALKVCKISS